MRAIAFSVCMVACASPPPEPAKTPAAPEPQPIAVVAAPAEASEPEPAASPEPEPAPPVAEPEPPMAEPPAPAAEPAPPKVAATARDPRRASASPRPRALLVTELQALERLHQATPKSSPDRPQLMRRLAEGYVELEHAAEREPDGAKLVKAARKSALKYYLAVRSEYPTFAKLDEVLYYAGYEHERGGDLAQARAFYRELGSKFPSSPFRARVPENLGR